MIQLILALLQVASVLSATSSLCNPLSATSCPAETALATDIEVDFTDESDYFDVTSTESGVSYSDDGLKLTLAKRFDNPSLKSAFYIMFGRVEVSLKAASGTGIVSSFYLQSNDLDEIDIELIGSDDTQWQSNYFVQGNTDTYDRGAFHDTSSAPQDDYHNYTIDWTNERIIWYYDGTAVRTLSNDSSQGFPQSPMYLMTGIWAGGDSSNDAGTIEWAGGETDYSDAPFAMYINKLKISDYSSGDSYEYTDQSGDWTSIKANNGKVLGRLSDADTSGSYSSSSKSSSSSSSSSPSLSSSSSSTSSSSSSTAASSSAVESSEAASTAQASSTEESSSEKHSTKASDANSSSESASEVTSDSPKSLAAESTTLASSKTSSGANLASESLSSTSASSSTVEASSDSGATKPSVYFSFLVLIFCIL